MCYKQSFAANSFLAGMNLFFCTCLLFVFYIDASFRPVKMKNMPVLQSLYHAISYI